MLDPEQILKDFFSNFIPEELRLKREVQALKENPNITSYTMTEAKVVTPKTKYDLLNKVDAHRTEPQTLLFAKEDEEGELIHNGTTSEAVLDVMIHRTKAQFDSIEDDDKKEKLGNAIKQLSWARNNIEEAFSE